MAGLIPLVAPAIYQQFPQWFQTVFGAGIVRAPWWPCC